MHYRVYSRKSCLLKKFGSFAHGAELIAFFELQGVPEKAGTRMCPYFKAYVMYVLVTMISDSHVLFKVVATNPRSIDHFFKRNDPKRKRLFFALFGLNECTSSFMPWTWFNIAGFQLVVQNNKIQWYRHVWYHWIAIRLLYPAIPNKYQYAPISRSYDFVTFVPASSGTHGTLMIMVNYLNDTKIWGNHIAT